MNSRGGNNFFENFGNKVRFVIGRKLVCKIESFFRRGYTCLNDDGKVPSERASFDKVFDWAKFIEASQKESWYGIKRTAYSLSL